MVVSGTLRHSEQHNKSWTQFVFIGLCGKQHIIMLTILKA